VNCCPIEAVEAAESPDSAMQTNEERVAGSPFVAKMEFEDWLLEKPATPNSQSSRSMTFIIAHALR